MNAKTLVLAVAGAALMVAAPAFADPPGHARAHGWRAKQPHHHRTPAVVIYRPGPVIYAPAPVYYAPPPVIHVPARVYYAPPRPVLHGHIPVGPDLHVSFGLRL